MGMISGTAVANVLTTGTISIPLMKRTGYRSETAGAIEAVASTGGQLMPPVMGAAAFLMSDMTGISYFEIAKAALLPAILYYIVLFSVVHLESIKRNIPILGTKDIPSLSKTFCKRWALTSLVASIYLYDVKWILSNVLFGLCVDDGCGCQLCSSLNLADLKQDN